MRGEVEHGWILVKTLLGVVFMVEIKVHYETSLEAVDLAVIMCPKQSISTRSRVCTQALPASRQESGNKAAGTG